VLRSCVPTMKGCSEQDASGSGLNMCSSPVSIHARCAQTFFIAHLVKANLQRLCCNTLG
jgi:hypothetical protein